MGRENIIPSSRHVKTENKKRERKKGVNEERGRNNKQK